ncbi:MAG: complex I subunit 1 family protein [Planctomycetales bacterium]
MIALPFSDGWVAQNLDIALFYMFAMMSLEVIGVILAGYSSGSKWSLFGGMREAAQVVSYEIPMAICALVPIVSVGTLNLVELGRVQSGWFTNWLIFENPFCFIAFFCYFTVATASVKRAPFDLAEAESELVAGFHTEYSGIRWSYFFMAEYSSMLTVSGIACYLFLGGWHTGLPIIPESMEGGLIANLIGLVVFVLKASVLVCVQIWVRWTLPRLRIDQVMMTCLKYLVPISCFLFLGAISWPLMIHAMTSGKSTGLPISRPMGARLYRKVLQREQPPAVAAALPVKPAEKAAPKPAAPATKGDH